MEKRSTVGAEINNFVFKLNRHMHMLFHKFDNPPYFKYINKNIAL